MNNNNNSFMEFTMTIVMVIIVTLILTTVLGDMFKETKVRVVDSINSDILGLLESSQNELNKSIDDALEEDVFK